MKKLLSLALALTLILCAPVALSEALPQETLFIPGTYEAEAQGFAGTVAEMSIVSTKLTLPDNRFVSLPNGSLSNGTINNYTRNPYRRVEWKISLAYGTDAAACRDLLLKLLKEDERVLDSKTKGAADPMTALFSLDDSAIVFVVRGWVKASDYWDVYFDYNQRAYTILPQNGFGFPFPQMDVHIQNQ